jgi:hypothetical protein
VINSLRRNWWWIQWVEFLSAYFFVFVSYFKGPEKWKKEYLNVMPIVFAVVFIFGTCITFPLIEWFQILWHRAAINQTGYANYFYLCGALQLAYVILVFRQLTDMMKKMHKKVVDAKRQLAEE